MLNIQFVSPWFIFWFLLSFFVGFNSANPPDLMARGQAQDLDNLKQTDKVLMLNSHLLFWVFKVFFQLYL